MKKQLLLVYVLLCSLWVSGQPLFVEKPGLMEQPNFLGADEYGSGVAAADFDRDGDIDLFVPTGCGQDNLILTNHQGMFSVFQALDLDIDVRAGLWLDYDGDGRLDLLIAGDCCPEATCTFVETVLLFQQTPTGTLDLQSDILPISTSEMDMQQFFAGVSAGDLNNDGWLDMILTYWPGEPVVLINDNGGGFTFFSDSLAINQNLKYWQPIIYDYNNDGWADIFFSVDKSANLFYENNRDGTFTEKARQYYLADDGYDMGVTLGDYDNDRDMDLYVTNAFQQGFHNTLYVNQLNNTEFTFTDASVEQGVDNGAWGWGTTFLDANLDGFLDLAATNGWYGEYENDASLFWLNRNGNFDDVSASIGFNDTDRAVSLIQLDWDRDGDPDLVQTLLDENLPQGIRFFENQLEQANESHYLVVKPRMTGANKLAIGSTVSVRTNRIYQTRPIIAGTSIYGQEPAEALFGLGNLETVDEIIITWPGGESTRLNNVSSNQVLEITDTDVLHAPVFLGLDVEDGVVELDVGHMQSSQTGYRLEVSNDQDLSVVDQVHLESVDESIQYPVEADITYSFSIAAVKDEEIGPFSRVVEARWEPPVYVAAPENLQVISTSIAHVELEWEDHSDNEVQFEVQRSLDPSFDGFVSFFVGENETRMTDMQVEPNSDYYYRVRAVHPENYSDYSSIITASTVLPLSLNEGTKAFLFPNPARKTLWIDHNVLKKLRQIRVFDTSGRENLDWSLNSTGQFDWKGNSGFFFIRLDFIGGSSVTQKVLFGG